MTFAPDCAGIVPHESHKWRGGRCQCCHVSTRWPIAAQVCTRRHYVDRPPKKPRWQNAGTKERLRVAFRIIDGGGSQRLAARESGLDVKTVRRWMRIREAEAMADAG